MNYDDMQPEPRDPVVLAFLGTENRSLGDYVTYPTRWCPHSDERGL